MGKKSKSKKNKPSKAEKRLQKALYGDTIYSNEDIDVMEEHYNTLISSYWNLFSKTIKGKIGNYFGSYLNAVSAFVGDGKVSIDELKELIEHLEKK